ncbi:MAG: hypothetical protein ACTHKE_09975 [Sphingomicrobium sp.]|jgi:hypothetical protein
MKHWMFAAVTAFAVSPAAAEKPRPLFASDAPIHVTIRGPMSTLAANRAETPRPATMTVDGVTYPITLTTRGITRKTKDICDFPPLRVALTKPAPPGSLFDHQKHLKLVTHCKRSEDFQQKVLLEYSAYRLYNLMTPLSFRARLANIDYVDDNGKPYISRIGYFLEDFSDVAKRNGLTQAHMPSVIPVAQIDPETGARVAVFEYMISNYDWAMRAGPQGTECCHNTRLAAAAPGGQVSPVPYDFDYSGLVDAPYSVQPEGIPIDSVRQRLYRGYCVHIAQARTIASQVAARRAEFLGSFASVPGLTPREQAKAADYLKGFFADVDSGKIFRNCLN